MSADKSCDGGIAGDLNGQPPIPTVSYKVILVGDAEVGKTSWIKRISTGMFQTKYIPTVGVEVTKLFLNSSKGPIILDLWDTAGNESMGGLRDGYYIASNAAVIMTSLDNPATIKRTREWVQKVGRVCGDTGDDNEKTLNIPSVLIGNKHDLTQGQSPPTEPYARKHNLQYYEISVKNNFNLEKPLIYLARKLTGISDLTVSFKEHAPSSPTEVSLSHQLDSFQFELSSTTQYPKFSSPVPPSLEFNLPWQSTSPSAFDFGHTAPPPPARPDEGPDALRDEVHHLKETVELQRKELDALKAFIDSKFPGEFSSFSPPSSLPFFLPPPSFSLPQATDYPTATHPSPFGLGFFQQPKQDQDTTASTPSPLEFGFFQQPKQEKDTKKKPKRDPNAPKRPLNAYMLYFQDNKKKVQQEFPDLAFTAVTKKVASQWKDLSEEERAPYVQRAEESKRAYQKDVEEYNKRLQEKAGEREDKESQQEDEEDEDEDESEE